MRRQSDGGNISSGCSEVQKSDVEAFNSRRAFSFASQIAYWNSFCTGTASVLGVKEALSFGIILAMIVHFLKNAAAANQSSLKAKERERASLSLSVAVFCTDDWATGISWAT